MIKGADNKDQYLSLYEKITDEECREAYVYMIGQASIIQSLDCYPHGHGEVRDFRYYSGDEFLFAFIPNNEWLLFYFRTPALSRPEFAHDAVMKQFPQAEENNAGEIKLKIKNIDEAAKLVAFIMNA